MAAGELYPVQPLLPRLPARCHPPCRSGCCAGGTRAGGDAGSSDDRTGRSFLRHRHLGGRLYRLRCLCRCLSRKAGEKGAGNASRRDERESSGFPDTALLRLCQAPSALARRIGEIRAPYGKGKPVPAPSHGVLGRLLRLRRDTLRQAADPAFRSRSLYCQRHRLQLYLGQLLPILRLHHGCGRSWTGMVKLPV